MSEDYGTLFFASKGLSIGHSTRFLVVVIQGNQLQDCSKCGGSGEIFEYAWVDCSCVKKGQNGICIQGKTRVFVLIKGGCVHKGKRSNESENSNKYPTKEIVADTEHETYSFCAKSLVHKGQHWA
ncbi:uncharacterized protein A4U43_C02F17410 [Asparagus officinalis]|uniref:Uncharacterized protein n=1 Tax=Asparagus officinalis TaxID=4686 RepID=A0A5P1FNW6_ASPOF|nr:uncharacterized protein A4U43_C02F17410 [Asparagus officinalis]